MQIYSKSHNFPLIKLYLAGDFILMGSCVFGRYSWQNEKNCCCNRRLVQLWKKYPGKTDG